MGDEVNSRLHAGSLRVDRCDRPSDRGGVRFLADGENDPKFSPPVLEITKTTEGPPDVGTVYTSTVKDAGVKTREFKLTEFEPPTRIRWTEVSKNLVSAPEGTYDLAPESARRSNGSGTPDRTSPTSTAPAWPPFASATCCCWPRTDDCATRSPRLRRSWPSPTASGASGNEL
jgi:hypothetical protein